MNTDIEQLDYSILNNVTPLSKTDKNIREIFKQINIILSLLPRKQFNIIVDAYDQKNIKYSIHFIVKGNIHFYVLEGKNQKTDTIIYNIIEQQFESGLPNDLSLIQFALDVIIRFMREYIPIGDPLMNFMTELTSKIVNQPKYIQSVPKNTSTVIFNNEISIINNSILVLSEPFLNRIEWGPIIWKSVIFFDHDIHILYEDGKEISVIEKWFIYRYQEKFTIFYNQRLDIGQKVITSIGRAINNGKITIKTEN